ncbi:hypothetical protein CYL18_04810 [Pradoshia eiseniae]|uniref:Uncharacterized protein n=1 Tax=Pradoshia eiseniae TaxID=2064768 RepID=A0A2S7N5A1_9BACI|nr:hypothetical protein CYL18_04810 [Pradoshia eiseniae]
MSERWEKPGNAHLFPRQQAGRVGKGCPKGGKSQAMPTLCPGNRYERWGKGVRKVGEARQCPPFAQTTGRKGGNRVSEKWEKPGNAHPLPRQQVG